MITIIEVILFVYLAGCVLYNLLLAIAGRLSRKKKIAYEETVKYARIAILIPAYKEDSIILSTVNSYNRLRYPLEQFEVVVIADSLQPRTMEELAATGVNVIAVKFDKSTKAKSLNTAFERLGDNYDLALICDADNMLEADFLLKINHAYQQGHYAIQGQRVAKNLNTPFAILDAANEIIANHLYRKGANALGLSSSVIGSGMAFHYPLIKQILSEIQATGGFDKVLQLLVISKGHSILYLEDAYVYDEKITHAAVFENQRKRWMSSQLVYLRTFWSKGWSALFKGDVNYFNLAVCQNALLPRMLLLAALTVCTALAFLLERFIPISVYWWIALFILNILSLLLPVPGKFFTKYLFTAVLTLPRAVGIMILLLFRLKGADKTFIHTTHTQTGIDNPLLDAARK
jgi:cellulose synthase/poly-beta-1,6-N-acetylglucosamine synthase-like glycosyltransferase